MKINFIFRGFPLLDYVQRLWLGSCTILVNDITKEPTLLQTAN